MIDVNKIKVGDKLRVICNNLLSLDEIEDVVTVVDYYLGENGSLWIDGDKVSLEGLGDYDNDRFELIEDSILTDLPMVPAEPQYETIIITSPAYEYMGLMKGSKHKIHAIIDGIARFTNNGKLWQLSDSYWEWDVEKPMSDNNLENAFNNLRMTEEEHQIAFGSLQKSQPIKSDGGSSSYYTIPLPDDVIDRIVKNRAIETEDILKYGLGNDFDFSNIGKSLVRLWGTVNGAGKAGNDAKYELSKIRYSLNKIEKFFVK